MPNSTATRRHEQLTKLARRCLGPSAVVTRNPGAREQNSSRADYETYSKQVREVEAEIEERSATFESDLYKAVQFVCDVNGDPPSIDQLKEVNCQWDELREREYAREHIAQCVALADRDRNRHRFELEHREPGEYFGTTRWFDTVDELKAFLRTRPVEAAEK